ncbi:MAG: hypothetical protein NTY38_15250, partial [Acidobacteria bacterium]|nr:hypothetical protein [Acidobacteriota bacterium]
APSGRAEWFYQARWGVFIHFLGTQDLSAEEWSRRIDAFDVEGLAKQLESVHASYLMLTLGQNSGHYLSPNRTYDSFVGIKPSKCSRRDLIEDLYRVLAPKGIALMVYLPAGAPDRDPVAMERLEWTKYAFPNRNFQIKWEQVIAEWSKRWGKHVAGWWFDGCYWPNAMYRGAAAPNFASFAAAARKGNPGSVVAFNHGVFMPIISITPEEDYTAGEINEPERARCAGRYVDGAQSHMLSFLGQNWSRHTIKVQTSDARAWTKNFVERGGVVSWDVPTGVRGLIPADFLERLKAAGEGAAEAHRRN